MPKHYFNRLEYLSYLIEHKSTGNADDLSKKLGVCRRTVFEYLDILKSLNAEIGFDIDKKTYYYIRPGKFIFDFIPENFLQ